MTSTPDRPSKTCRFLTPLFFIFLLPILFITFRSPYKRHVIHFWSDHTRLHIPDTTPSSTTHPSPRNSSITKPTQPQPDITDPLNSTTLSNSSCNLPNPASYQLQTPSEPLPKVLRDYITFHKSARTCLTTPSCHPKPKILVANCPRQLLCLGLGDRMRGIVFSFIIAIITNRVLFLKHLSEPYPLEAGMSPSSIDWTLPSTVLYNHSWPYLQWYWCPHGATCSFGGPPLTNFSGFEGEATNGVNMLTDDVAGLFGDRPVVSLASRIVHKNAVFLERNPYLKDRYGDLGRAIVEGRVNIHRLLFQPSEATRKMMRDLEFVGDYVSVHIRNGIDAREAHLDRFQYLATHEGEVVNDMFGCLRRVVGANITNIFLASDSSTTKELFLRKGKENGFNVHAVGKATVHYEKTWKKGFDTWDAMCDGFVTVFADLFMLARGRVMIKTGSNLAQLAAYMGKDQYVVNFKPGSDSLEESCKPLTL